MLFFLPSFTEYCVDFQVGFILARRSGPPSTWLERSSAFTLSSQCNFHGVAFVNGFLASFCRVFGDFAKALDGI